MTTPSVPFGRLYWILLLFTTTAVAINLFMLGLMWQAIGLPALSPVAALLVAVPLGLPTNLLVTRWVYGLMARAETGR